MVLLFVSLLGILIVVFAIGLGGLYGEKDRIDADPEVRAEREQQKKERERQQRWKDLWK